FEGKAELEDLAEGPRALEGHDERKKLGDRLGIDAPDAGAAARPGLEDPQGPEPGDGFAQGDTTDLEFRHQLALAGQLRPGPPHATSDPSQDRRADLLGSPLLIHGHPVVPVISTKRIRGLFSKSGNTA